jgi:hypothetical protein
MIDGLKAFLGVVLIVVGIAALLVTAYFTYGVVIVLLLVGLWYVVKNVIKMAAI